MSDWYVIDQRGHRVGPISPDRVAQMIVAGDLNAQSLAWNESLGDNWKLLEETEFLDLLRKQPPPLKPATRPVPERISEREATLEAYKRQAHLPRKEPSFEPHDKTNQSAFYLFDFLQEDQTKNKISKNYEKYFQLFQSNEKLNSSYPSPEIAINRIKKISIRQPAALLLPGAWWGWRNIPYFLLISFIDAILMVGSFFVFILYYNQSNGWIFSILLLGFLFKIYCYYYGNSYYLAHLIDKRNESIEFIKPKLRNIFYSVGVTLAVFISFFLIDVGGSGRTFWRAFGESFVAGYRGQALGSSGLPVCHGALARDEVRRTFQNSPAGRVHGLEIIGWINAEELSNSPQDRRCRATIRLNSGGDIEIEYRFYFDNVVGGGRAYFIEIKERREREGRELRRQHDRPAQGQEDARRREQNLRYAWSVEATPQPYFGGRGSCHIRSINPGPRNADGSVTFLIQYSCWMGSAGHSGSGSITCGFGYPNVINSSSFSARCM